MGLLFIRLSAFKELFLFSNLYRFHTPANLSQRPVHAESPCQCHGSALSWSSMPGRWVLWRQGAGMWGAGVRFIRVSGEWGSPGGQRWSLLPSGSSGMPRGPPRLPTMTVGTSRHRWVVLPSRLAASQKKKRQGTAIRLLLWFSL